MTIKACNLKPGDLIIDQWISDNPIIILKKTMCGIFVDIKFLNSRTEIRTQINYAANYEFQTP